MSFPSRSGTTLSTILLDLTPQQLKNPDLLHNESFIHGKWVKSKSGKTFEVAGEQARPITQYRLTDYEIPAPVRHG
jgi:hypothetical protein